MEVVQIIENHHLDRALHSGEGATDLSSKSKTYGATEIADMSYIAHTGGDILVTYTETLQMQELGEVTMRINGHSYVTDIFNLALILTRGKFESQSLVSELSEFGIKVICAYR